MTLQEHPQVAHVHLSHSPDDDSVAILTLDDSARRNALSTELCEELCSHMAAVEADGRTGAVVVTGTSPAFCAGADLSQLGDSRKEGLLAIYEGFLSVARSPIPTIAAVNGPAVGAGMNLALACDVRVAGPRARYDCRFLDLGIHPGGGHTWMLQRIVGPQAANAMVVMGEVIDSQRSVEIGLSWSAHGTDEELTQAALRLASRAASVPRELSRAAKATLQEVHPLSSHMEAMELELVKQLHSMDQPAFAERLAQLQAKISNKN